MRRWIADLGWRLFCWIYRRRLQVYVVGSINNYNSQMNGYRFAK